MSALHFRKTSDSSSTLHCSVLPLDFYHYVDCFAMTMINVTVLKVIRKLLRVLYVVWFHFVLILHFSIWPRLGLELLALASASASSFWPRLTSLVTSSDICYCRRCNSLQNWAHSYGEITTSSKSYFNGHKRIAGLAKAKTSDKGNG